MASAATASATEPPTPPRKLFKPATRTKAPTPIKSRPSSSVASTVRDEYSPPPPIFPRKFSSDSRSSAQELSKHWSQPPPVTPKHNKSGGFTSQSASPVFRRKASSASATNPAGSLFPPLRNGHRSPSVASDYTSRSLSRSRPGSVFGDSNSGDDDGSTEERQGAGNKHDLSSLPEEQSTLTPTQIFKARAKKSSQKQQQQKTPREIEVEEEQPRTRSQEASPSPKGRKQPAEHSASTEEENSIAEKRRTSKDESGIGNSEDEANQQNIEIQSSQNDPQGEDDQRDTGALETTKEPLDVFQQQDPDGQPPTAEQKDTEDRSISEDEQKTAADRKPSFQSEPDDRQDAVRQTDGENHKSVEKEEIPEGNDENKSLSSKSAEILDPNTPGFASRAFGSLSSGASTIADKFKSPADLIKFFSSHGHPEMSNFVSALEGNEDLTDKSQEHQEKDQSYEKETEPEQSSPAPKMKPIRRPGIMKPGKQEDGSQFFDNMGRPVRIERSVDIPLPRGEPKSVEYAPLPMKTNQQSDAEENKDDLSALPQIEDLASPDDLTSTEQLRSTDDLEDPPEEYLDPKLHSPQTPAKVTPISRIGRISPIMKPEGGTTMKLPNLADGLEGFAVDDVGNVVDEKGKVLGYVAGDLPSMVGKKVAEGGKVYDENGEVLGHVTENFLNDEEDNEDDSDDLTDALNGLRVDHDGNILDTQGNIVGRLNEPPAGNGKKRQDQDQQQQQKSSAQSNGTDQNKKPDRKNPNKGRSPAVPADISLDVKSTYDGIQIIIKIPTMFDKAPQTITIT